MAAMPLRLTIMPLIAGTACGASVWALFHLLFGKPFDFNLVMTLIVLSISSIVAALACVYPIFLVFPRSRVPGVWLGTVWGAAIGVLLAGLIFTWDRGWVASLGTSGAAAGLGYSLLARRQWR